MDLIILEDNKASKFDYVQHSDLDDLKLNFYVAVIVFAGAILILFACIIALFAWIHKLSISLKEKDQLISNFNATGTMGRAVKPEEELGKRYTVAAEDHNNIYDKIVSESLYGNYGFQKNSNNLGRSLNQNGIIKHVDKLDESKADSDKSYNKLRDTLYY